MNLTTKYGAGIIQHLLTVNKNRMNIAINLVTAFGQRQMLKIYFDSKKNGSLEGCRISGSLSSMTRQVYNYGVSTEIANASVIRT